MRNLKAVGERVLSVTGPVPQLTDQFDQFGVHGLDPRFEHGLLTRFKDLFLNILLCLLYDLLDPRRMDPSIEDKPFQGEAGNLSPHRIETAQGHRFGRIIHDKVDPCEGLKGTDVPSFPANNSPLHFVRWQGYHADGHFRGMVNSTALYGTYYDLPGFAFGLPSCFFLELLEFEPYQVRSLFFHFLEENILGLFP